MYKQKVGSQTEAQLELGGYDMKQIAWGDYISSTPLEPAKVHAKEAIQGALLEIMERWGSYRNTCFRLVPSVRMTGIMMQQYSYKHSGL